MFRGPVQIAFYIFAIIIVGGLFLAAVLLILAAGRQSLADDSHLSRSRMLIGECRQCGYNLNKNTSGVCPECGTPLIDDADLAVPGRLTCCLCGKLLGWEDREDDGVLATPPARLPPFEPMRMYVNAQMHRSCWNLWTQRDRFIQVVNASPGTGWRIDRRGRATPVDAAAEGSTPQDH
jgi:hypothetical protein